MFETNLGKKLNWLIPVITGVAVFLLVIGPKVLDVSNIAWLQHGEIARNNYGGDNAQHYLGWVFFRNSDWTFPIIGSNPAYGLELSNSIVYSDSIPLLAIFFKAVAKRGPVSYFINRS